ncbi:hypothetical protein [Shewanella algae]|uniref:hypothetical protein n=1 Tax=Shewanella algae TaxID=38313 RepID=UPI0031F50BE4
MRIWHFAFLSLLLLGCSSTNKTTYQPVCFQSVEQAINIGESLISAGYFEKVSYWVNGDPSIPVRGLGLKWDGFEHSKYCPSGRYPVLISYLDKDELGNSEIVIKWAQIVFKNMLKERGIET